MNKIINPKSQAQYNIKRFHGRKGYYVVRDPFGRYAKVKKENVAFIPDTWKVYKNTNSLTFYQKHGVYRTPKIPMLNETTHCLLEITSRKHARWFESPRNINLGIIFGRLSDAKEKKNLFQRASDVSKAVY